MTWPFKPLLELNWTVEFEVEEDDEEEDDEDDEEEDEDDEDEDDDDEEEDDEDEDDEEEEDDTDAMAASIASTTPLMASLFSNSSLFLAWLSAGASAVLGLVPDYRIQF